MVGRAFSDGDSFTGPTDLKKAGAAGLPGEQNSFAISTSNPVLRSRTGVASTFAPIAVFAYRRLHHLDATLDALTACPEFADSEVFIFCDGPKASSADDVAKVREWLHRRRTPNMTIIESPTNRGLAASVTTGVTFLCEKFGRAIVIEDDLIVAPSTLTWFNRALDQYADDDRVWQISAHQFAVPEFSTRDKGMFLHLTTSWGWAVWKRSWDKYDPEAIGWEHLEADEELRRQFDCDDSYPYSDMLIDQMKGRVDSWAIRWNWSMFRAGGVCLFPPRSLTTNIGTDGTATHRRFRLLKRFAPPKDLGGIRNLEKCPSLPREIRVDRADDAAVAKALRAASSLVNRLVCALSRQKTPSGSATQA